MAQLLISHRFQSGLHNHMKLHTISTGLELAYKLSIESDHKYGDASCFKRGSLKIQYRALMKG